MSEIPMDPLQKQMLDDVFDAFSMLAPNGYISLMHVEGGFTRYTPAAVELFGLPGEYIPNGAMNWVDWVHPEDQKRYLAVMGRLSAGESYSYDLTYRVRIHTGEYAQFRVVGATLRNAQGKPSLIGGAMFNEGLATTTDPLTMLPNQSGFFRDLEAMTRGEGQLTALLLGVNRLSDLNDTYGYGYGNRILQQVAWTIQETVRDRAGVYRMSGSKFALLSDTISPQEVSALYDSIQLKLQRGVRVGSIRHNLTISGGLVSAKGYQMEPGSFHTALTFAYRESRLRRHGDLIHYNGKLDDQTGASLQMLGDIRSAVLDGCRGFYLDYQPVFRPGREAPIGAEVLVRWQGEPHGVVPPLSFLPLLEQNFIFEELGDWILRRATTDALPLVEREPDFMLGFNISHARIEDPYFVDNLLQILKRTGFPAKNLCLELTRGVRLLDLGRVARIVQALKEHGIRILIDDFGSGGDSLAFLKHLSPDYVKLDRDLLRDIETSEADRQSLRRLVELGTIYGAHVCAKGVETAAVLELLRDYPIRSFQGFHYAPPLPLEELMDRYLPAP